MSIPVTALARRLVLIVAALFTLVGYQAVRPSAADAHRSGCHAAHSCPSDTGSYVCGDKGISTYCGTAQGSSATTAPSARVQGVSVNRSSGASSMADTGPSTQVLVVGVLGVVVLVSGSRMRGRRPEGSHFV